MRLATPASALLPLLRRIDPERAHDFSLAALRLGLAGRDDAAPDPTLAVRALGLDFANPIGLAAGFDKNAVVVPGLMRLGFGFVETGTVTPRPQPGNPRPRLFRLPGEQAVINRMGFNNRGIEAYCNRLSRLGQRTAPLGANIGINKLGAEPERDYPAMVRAIAGLADYIVINVSSPNTPGLRDLQGEAQLSAILSAIAAAVPRRPPLLIKLAPDLSPEGLATVVAVAVSHAIDGLIVSNTTLHRPDGLAGAHAGEAGGLSGPPLRARSTEMLRAARRLSGGRLTLIGCGGISTGRDALEKIRAGASLVQIYTAFAYQGPGLIPRVKRELAHAIAEDGFGSVAQAIGVDA